LVIKLAVILSFAFTGNPGSFGFKRSMKAARLPTCSPPVDRTFETVGKGGNYAGGSNKPGGIALVFSRLRESFQDGK
jgi:hypothetical protein